MTQKSNRTFSKKLAMTASVGSWLAVFAAMTADTFWFGAAVLTPIVMPSMVGMIWGVLGIYMGVGHADLRKLADVAKSGVQPQTADSEAAG